MQLAPLPSVANGQLGALLAATGVACRERDDPELGVGEMTLERFRADVSRLSKAYMIGEPFALYQQMRRVRARMHDALDRRICTRDATELYLLLGCVNDLMALAADDLGYSQAAQELLRSAWVHAVAIDHHPLMARVRVNAANVAYWGKPKRSAEMALSGLEHMPGGPSAAYLHLAHGRAAARQGDADTARRAIAEAGEARDREHSDDLLIFGGEFSLSRASERALAGATLVEIPGAERQANVELQTAIGLYDQGPDQGEDHSRRAQMTARIDLSTARLRVGQLDGAAVALAPVLSLPPGQRVRQLSQRLARTRTELAAPIFRGSAQASDLARQIEEFSSESITTDLHALVGGFG